MKREAEAVGAKKMPAALGKSGGLKKTSGYAFGSGGKKIRRT